MAHTYKEAGVNIDAGNEFVKKILPHVKSTYRPEVLSGVGGFAAHFSLNLEGIESPVLVSSTDGVGTKLKIAQKLNKFNTIGIDLVAMCVNDLLCSGARPLFFLDYFAMESLKPKEHSEIVAGIADGCRQSGAALIGGETAELPGIYQKGDFDLAGFSVGIVDEKKIIDGSSISIGNTIIGIASSGIHSNGYSLVRKIVEDEKLSMDEKVGDKTLGECLIEPTKIYAKLLENIIRDFDVCGIAHITGGGLLENIPRVLPNSCKAKVALSAWDRPEIFKYLQSKGDVAEVEMQRVFNLGIGMILVVPAEKSMDICERIRSFNEEAWVIGEVTEKAEGEAQIVLE